MTAPAPGTAVQTVGPTDPNAGFRAKAYTVVSSLLGLVTLAQTFHLVTDAQAAGINGVASAGIGLVGAVTTAIAAFNTKKQVNNGTFDQAPPPPPAITAVQGIQAVANQFNDLTKQVVAGINHVSDTAAGLQNLVGAGLSQVLPGSLVDQLLHQERQHT